MFGATFVKNIIGKAKSKAEQTLCHAKSCRVMQSRNSKLMISKHFLVAQLKVSSDIQMSISLHVDGPTTMMLWLYI